MHHLPTCCYACQYYRDSQGWLCTRASRGWPYFVYVLIQNILSIIHNLFLAEDPLHKDPLSVPRPEEVLE